MINIAAEKDRSETEKERQTEDSMTFPSIGYTVQVST